MSELKKTVLCDAHIAAGATMVDFGGWYMPIQYPTGIIAEHLWCRSKCGIFDVSHMGRLRIRGKDRLAFVQHVLTNNAAALKMDHAQYTILSDEQGSAIDDAYLYRFELDEYLLVVNASNTEKDLDHLRKQAAGYDVELTDLSDRWDSIAVQGPESNAILAALADCEVNPETPVRNTLHIVKFGGREVYVAVTGYTGEPLCYELYTHREDTVYLWNRLIELGAKPIGLGARDTLRMEATLPLYGHEMGECKFGGNLPVYAVPLSRFAVSFAEEKGDFIGKEALAEQHEEYLRIKSGDCTDLRVLPDRILPIALTGKGVLRAGCDVFDPATGECCGYVTSGTMIPYFESEGTGAALHLTEKTDKRSLGMAYLRADLRKGAAVEVDIRGRRVPAAVVGRPIKVDSGRYVEAVVCKDGKPKA